MIFTTLSSKIMNLSRIKYNIQEQQSFIIGRVLITEQNNSQKTGKDWGVADYISAMWREGTGMNIHYFIFSKCNTAFNLLQYILKPIIYKIAGSRKSERHEGMTGNGK